MWSINTPNGFINSVGFTKRQAVEIIIKSLLLEDQEKSQEEQQKGKKRGKRITRRIAAQ